eukprot:4741542-Prymnesium_polylepis.1
MTCLLYLNDVPVGCGGATWFPKADLRVQPRAGRAIVWRNVRPNGAVDPDSIHAGELVRRGRATGGGSEVREKFVFSKWVRARPFAVDNDASFGVG